MHPVIAFTFHGLLSGYRIVASEVPFAGDRCFSSEKKSVARLLP
jgi:hypothetical protein